MADLATILGHLVPLDHTDFIDREPDSSVTDNAICLWDGTGGRNVKNSVVTISAAGLVVGVTQMNIGDLILSDGSVSTAANDLTLSATGGEIIFDDNAFFADNNLITFGNTVGAHDVAMGFDGTTFNIDARAGTANQVIFGENASNIDGRVRLFRLGVAGSNTSGLAYINADVTGTGRQILNFVLTYQGVAAAAAVGVLNVTDEGTSATFTLFGQNIICTLNTTNHTTYTQIGQDVTLNTNSSIVIPAGKNYDFFGSRVQHGTSGGTHTGGDIRTFGFYQTAIPTYTGVNSQLIYGGFFEDDIGTEAGNKVIFDGTSTTLGDTYLSYDSGDSELDVFVDNTEYFNFGATNQSRSDLGVAVGTTSGPTFAAVGGTIEVQSNDVGNVGVGEDDLHSYSLPANSLNTDEDYLVWEAYFTAADDFRLRCYFGTTVIYDTGNVVLISPPQDLRVRVTLIRTGAAAQRIGIQHNLTTGGITYATSAETLSGALTMKFTADNVTNNDDLIQHMTTIRYYPAPL